MAMNLVDRTKLDAALTATADAIRVKTGGAAQLDFDMENGTGFEDAIENSGLVKPSGTKGITENGTHDVSGFASANVNVPPTPTQSKTLTLGAAAPSTVTPDSGKVLSSVPVTIDTNVIKAANIAKGVTILGITGTHEEGLPIEISTAAGMNAVLIAANVGKVYMFTGTTDATYTNGDLYIVEAV